MFDQSSWEKKKNSILYNAQNLKYDLMKGGENI